jgi:hypothetical protein
MTKKQKDSSKPKRRRKYCKTSSKIIRRKKRKKSDSTKKLNDALLATLRDAFDEPEARNAALLATLDDIVGAEQSELDLKIRRGRGMAQKSRELIDAMYAAAEKAQPITGRGIGYKLFVQSLIASMSRADMQRVYRLLKEAREQNIIPWEWIVDETRELERVASWNDPEDYVDSVSRGYRRDFWLQQPKHVEVWSEKGTVRGLLDPMFEKYGVGFRAVHGFSSATLAHDIANDAPDKPLVILYVGDYDPSGMFMSEVDLPDRFLKYGGDHIELKRIALTSDQVRNLPSFPAKRKDPRYRWFVENYGRTCWELDALDPNDLRTIVEKAILKEIDPVAWKRCRIVEKAEKESLRTVLDNWATP